MVCPLTDLAELPIGKASEDTDRLLPGAHFVMSSGNQVKSYLTFAVDYVPVLEKDMNVAIEEEDFSVVRLQSVNNDKQIMVSYRYGDNLAASRLCVPKKNGLEVIDAGPFVTEEPTLAFF